MPIEAARSRDSKQRCASLVGRGLSGSTRRALVTKLVIDCDKRYLDGVAFGAIQAQNGRLSYIEGAYGRSYSTAKSGYKYQYIQAKCGGHFTL